MATTGDAMTGRPTALPTRKVAGGGVAGATATCLAWLYDICGLPGSPVPPEAAGALATMAAFAVSYALPPAPIETVLPDRADLPARQTG